MRIEDSGVGPHHLMANRPIGVSTAGSNHFIQFARAEQPVRAGPSGLARQNGPNWTNGLNGQSSTYRHTQEPQETHQRNPRSALSVLDTSYDCSNCLSGHRAYAACGVCEKFFCSACIDAHQRQTFKEPHNITMISSLCQGLTESLAISPRSVASSISPSSSKVVGAERERLNSCSSASSSTTPRPDNPLGHSMENISSLLMTLNRNPPVYSPEEMLELTPTNQGSASVVSPPIASPSIYSNQGINNGNVRRLGYTITNHPPGAYLPETPQLSPSSTYVASEAGDTGNDRLSVAISATVGQSCQYHHQMPFTVFCEECYKPLCNVCVQLYYHNNHRLVHVSQGMSRARQHIEELKGQIRQCNTGLRNKLDTFQKNRDGMDYQASEVAYYVRYYMKQVVAATEHREQELLRIIDYGRNQKSRIIGYQMENVGLHLSKLAQAADYLNALNNCDNFKIMMINAEVAREIRHARQLVSVESCEDDRFHFLPPTKDLFHCILNMGHLDMSRSSLSNSVLLYKQPVLSRMQDINDVLQNSPNICRPIYGVNKKIYIQNYGSFPIKVWGRQGPDRGHLCRPWGITTNRFGQIIVADRSNHRIQVFDSECRYLFHFGSHGEKTGEFDRPTAVAVNPCDNIVVVDKDNHRIQVFSKRGDFLLTFGERGCQIGQFLYPWDVAIDSQGNILVSDTRNHRIQLFRWNGVFLNKWGGDWYANLPISRLFDSPRGVAFDPLGNILVTDFNLHRVVIICRTSGHIKMLGYEGSGTSLFYRPQGIFCDERGWFVVADSKNFRIQVFNEKAEFLWMSGGKEGTKPGEFCRPTDMFVDPEGHIHVMDFGNDRIQVY